MATEGNALAILLAPWKIRNFDQRTARPTEMHTKSLQSNFYDAIYQSDQYASFSAEDAHFAAAELRKFVRQHSLQQGRCLEVGSGRGAFQDIVADYTGLDLSCTVKDNYHKPFISGSAEELPFSDNQFDGIWCITVLEHIPNPERALNEMRRVLKPGGDAIP